MWKEIVKRYEAFCFDEILDLLNALPKNVRDLADKNYELLKANPKHPSLHFKQIGNLWSVRVGKRYRALGLDKKEGIV